MSVCPLRPSPARGEVSAHAVGGGGALMFPPRSERDDDDGGVVLRAVLQRLKNTHCLSLVKDK